MEPKKICIVGGGSAGLAAAITAARAGASVIVLEHMDRIGKKLLSTGNGRCNFTNEAVSPEKYFSGCPQTVKDLLQEYPSERICCFFQEIGVQPWQRDGYFYPASAQASAVLDCLRDECDRLNIKILCQTNVKQIKKEHMAFQIRTDQGTYRCDRLILACGGQAAPFSGSDGSGYELARGMGHRICTPFPALTALTADSRRMKSMAGVRVRCRAILEIDGRRLNREEGELQLTENGLSGIVIFQLSHPAVEAFQRHRPVQIHLDFLPDLPQGQAFGFLKERCRLLGHKTLEQWGIGLLPKKLWLRIVKESGLPADSLMARFDNRQLGILNRLITDFCVPITGFLGFDRAQVTAGGVDASEVVPQTMESKRVRGLYLAGEILDVDGLCGGYNLHWAFASGMAAGAAAAE